MPKRTDIKKILIIGAGPIVIGQACEFDYSGSQACKALKEEGYEIVLINSNPATIMTDPDMADKTYIEPITVEYIEQIIAKERPDALLPTLGGQTALNMAVELYEKGILEKYGVEMIGAKYDAIIKGEDRELFRQSMDKIGIKVPENAIVHTLEEALKAVESIGFPAIIRPGYTLGGTGGGIAYNIEEFETIVKRGLDLSIKSEVQIDKSLIGWKEFELEVMRDTKDNVVIICSIENFDAMGVHTGDSITVAPAQTLTDKEYQILRDYSIAVIREIGVDTGGSNIQFAVNPVNGDVVAIEMNPRVSRSSALASKATGFPIAKFAAKLSVGYTLDEIPNDITKETPASFEPTLDYVVVKIPRFTFEKFKEAKPVLGTQMKSVGETMAIGRTFKEALQKGLRSLERNLNGLDSKIDWANPPEAAELRRIITEKLTIPNEYRVLYVKDALKAGFTVDEIYRLSFIDPWFVEHINEILAAETEQAGKSLQWFDKDKMKEVKQLGFSDAQIAKLLGGHTSEHDVRTHRKSLGVLPTYKLVDTCAAEFQAKTPYFYSCYEDEDESFPTNRKKVMILGSGPNRIGQGIEFDYACVHCSMALREMGFESIMVNSNPETVSTDYDISDKLYFEPLTFEDVMNIYETEKPMGVVLQFGGQTPLRLALLLHREGVPILGTSPDAIDIAEDRDRFHKLIEQLGFLQPPSATATTKEAAIETARTLGYPILVRPSYVLGGRAMMIVYKESELLHYLDTEQEALMHGPILIDKYLENAQEIDVDACGDGDTVVVAGIMQHIEEAGIHSGDSAMILPPISIDRKHIDIIINQTIAMGKALNVIGLMNIQYAIKDDRVYFIEVNPRASRTVPFVSKATGIPWAKVATQVVMGRKLADMGYDKYIEPKHISVKEVVLPFNKFPEVDAVLNPEMKSTGEVMGIDDDFGHAFLKAEIASGMKLPTSGNILVSLNNLSKDPCLPAIRKLEGIPAPASPPVETEGKLSSLGTPPVHGGRAYKIFATGGTADYLKAHGVECEIVKKLHEGRPNIIDEMKNGNIHLIFNTPAGEQAHIDDTYIRKTATLLRVPLVTTSQGIIAMADALEAQIKRGASVKALQEYFTK